MEHKKEATVEQLGELFLGLVPEDYSEIAILVRATILTGNEAVQSKINSRRQSRENKK